jgi:hypothetical protein
MRSPDEYREFAAECYRMASEAETEAQEKILREMALGWSEDAGDYEKLAEWAEKKFTRPRGAKPRARPASTRGRLGSNHHTRTPPVPRSSPALRVGDAGIAVAVGHAGLIAGIIAE